MSTFEMKRLARLITEHIFAIGDESNLHEDGEVHRIEFKGGEWPDNERAQGGLSRISFEKSVFVAIQNAEDKKRKLKKAISDKVYRGHSKMKQKLKA